MFDKKQKNIPNFPSVTIKCRILTIEIYVHTEFILRNISNSADMDIYFSLVQLNLPKLFIKNVNNNVH